MLTYVVGDIHGNYKGLIQAIKRSPFDQKNDHLITLGDYIDGGQHVEIMPVIDYLHSLNHWTGLIGNHDAMLLESLNNHGSNRTVWLQQGGLNTLRSLNVEIEADNGSFNWGYHVRSKLLGFLNSLKLYHTDDANNAYVHAGWFDGSEYIEDSATYKTNPEDLFWNRSFWKSANQASFQKPPYNKVFIGHSYNLNYPEKRHNIWNIDSGGGHNGCITIMKVNTEEYWQSDPTPDLYTNYRPRR